VCIYILIGRSSKNSCSIAQLDTGYVTVCFAERTKEFFGIAWPSMDSRGCYNFSSGFSFSSYFSLVVLSSWAGCFLLDLLIGLSRFAYNRDYISSCC
jgi:hypothetical protein